MKKSYILIGLFIVFIIIFTIIGSDIVTGHVSIYEKKDILVVQSNKELYFNVYGYSIDNPNVIVNPYGNSPLTAIIMFETDNYSEVSITIKSKNGNSDINYTFDNDKYHLIPIYGLYADYDNTVIIRSEGIEKIVNIKTGSLPADFDYIQDSEKGNFMFYNSNYPYAIDIEGEVRWYLNNHYYGNITLLDNSSIIIGSDRYTENGNTISFYKMNLLGKIYNEYLLNGDYYGYSVLYNGDILVLSDKILLVDIQTGEVINEYVSNEGFDYIVVDGDNIVVRMENVYYVINGDSLDEYNYNSFVEAYSFYNKTSNYNIVLSNRFGNLRETLVSDKNITLINYNKLKDLDKIDIVKETDRIKVTNNSKNNVYLILDKFMDKRIYEISDVKYINTKGLNGKYTVYLEINNNLYKTDYFVEV